MITETVISIDSPEYIEAEWTPDNEIRILTARGVWIVVPDADEAVFAELCNNPTHDLVLWILDHYKSHPNYQPGDIRR